MQNAEWMCYYTRIMYNLYKTSIKLIIFCIHTVHVHYFGWGRLHTSVCRAYKGGQKINTLLDLCLPAGRDSSLYQLGGPISWQPVINLPVIQIIKMEPQTAASLSFELISVVYLVH